MVESAVRPASGDVQPSSHSSTRNLAPVERTSNPSVLKAISGCFGRHISRFDPARHKGDMAHPSGLSLGQFPKKDTLRSVLNHWVSQAEGLGKKGRRRAKRLIEKSGAKLRDGRISVQDLTLKRCKGLTSLPKNLSVGGDLWLVRCKDLTSLPENLSVGGSIHLFDSDGLTSLPESLSVGGRLDLCSCKGLTSLPHNMSIGGDLDLSGLRGLTSLPENLSVGEDLDLIGCTGLTSLPESLNMNGSLRLFNCHGLTSLPDGMSVGRNLDLAGLVGLTRLPENLSCESLNMSHMSLTQVPAHLEKVKNLRVVNLYGNEITDISDRLGQLPEGVEIIVEGNPIPREELERFRAAHPHIVLRADDFDTGNRGAVNVHEPEMVDHFEVLYRTLVQLTDELNIEIPKSKDAQSSLLSAARKYNQPGAKVSIKYMLQGQKDRSVISFSRDMTSDGVLTRAWALVLSQAKKEDRDNGIKNLLEHLEKAKGFCNTRHAEEVLLALQDSYGVTLQKTASQARLNINELDESKIALTVRDAVDYFMHDMKAFLIREIGKESDISNDDLQEIFIQEIYGELEEKHSNVDSLQDTVNQVVQFIGRDWDTFVEMAKEDVLQYTQSV